MSKLNERCGPPTYNNAAKHLNHQRVLDLLSYSPETGEFLWRVKRAQQSKGAVAGTTDACGYRSIIIDRSRFRSHRLAWFYVHGVWPLDAIDHINGVRDDNRLVNLRESSAVENSHNMMLSEKNKSGHRGVHFSSGKWRATIRINKIMTHLGFFEEKADAAAAYLEARRLHYLTQPVPRELLEKEQA